MSRPIIILVFIILLTACLPGAGPQPLSDTEIQTAIAGTAQSLAVQIQATAQAAIPSLVPTDIIPPTETVAPTVPPVEMLLPPIPEAACVPAGNPVQVGLVTHVVDGDTIDVDIDGTVNRVRYIGIDRKSVV